MISDFDGDDYEVYVGARDEIMVVVERQFHAESRCRGIRRFLICGAQRSDFVRRQRPECRDVTFRRPPSVGIHADDADPDRRGHATTRSKTSTRVAGRSMAGLGTVDALAATIAACTAARSDVSIV